jgi:serine/threonine protein kinase/tetratricopeptide (TPR) repeat protein
LIEIGLIDAAELESFAADSAGGVLGLSRALVKGGKLTPYQAAAVYQKKSRGLLIGNYLILDKLGQGGMGVVFKARHRRLGRIGALKILPPSFARDRSAVMRFRREVEAAGRVKHPNLVAALDADEDRGVHFLVMDYVEGQDLHKFVSDRGPMPVAQAIDCVIQAARGLEAAHAQGIVHRDIKPANLMLDDTGTVRVLDLGLARLVDAANPFNKSVAGRLTESGMYMGTVDYMAPEQAEDSHRVDHKADIYSLGCTLYFLLTGREPFVGETVLKRLIAHMERPAPSLRAARADVPTALDEVYQKMMAKRAADRPASMAEVVAMLEAVKSAAGDVKQSATSKSRPELKVFDEQPLKRASTRRPEGDPSILARVLPSDGVDLENELNLEDLVMDVRSELSPSPTRPTQKPPAPTERVFERSAPTRSNRRPRRTGPVILGLSVTAAIAAVFLGFRLFPLTIPPDNDFDRARVVSVPESPAAPTPPIEPGAGTASVEKLPSIPTPGPVPPVAPAVEREPYVETAQFVGHVNTSPVEAVRVSPDGKRLGTTSSDKTARLWDIATGRELRRFWHPEFPRAIAFVPPHGRVVVTGCDDGGVRLWDVETGKLNQLLAKSPFPVRSVAVSPDGRRVAFGGDDRAVILSDILDGSSSRRLDCRIEHIRSVAFAPDGRRILAGGHRGLDIGDDAGADAMESIPDAAEKSIWEVAFTGDGRHAVSANAGGLTYWDLDSKRAVHEGKIEGYQVRALAFKTDSPLVLFGTQRGASENAWDGLFGTWDFGRGGEIIRGANGPAHLAIATLPGGSIASADWDGVARIWEPAASLARARELKKVGKFPDALAEYERAIARHPGDARLLIERGRLLASQGEAAKADADFTRAAQLAPESPQLFVAGGWWAAGPYPGGLDQLPSLDTSRVPDPTRPAPSAGSDERPWRDLAIGWPADGREGSFDLGAEQGGGVDLGATFRAEHISVYVMTYVYSAAPRDVVLLFGADDRAQVWLNGRGILRANGFTATDKLAIPVTLQAGRNVLLAAIANDWEGHGFHLRFADSPADFARAYVHARKWSEAREAYHKAVALEPENGDWHLHHEVGLAMAEDGRWKEAKSAFERDVALLPDAWWPQFLLAECNLALRDFTAYRKLCEAAIKRYGKNPNSLTADNLMWQTALIPNAVRDYAPLIAIGKKLMNQPKPDPNHFQNYGAILYRAKNYPSAISFLERSISGEKRPANAFDWIFIAMARHMSRQPGEREALEKARASFGKDSSWPNRLQYQALLEEAEEVLRLPPPP